MSAPAPTTTTTTTTSVSSDRQTRIGRIADAAYRSIRRHTTLCTANRFELRDVVLEASILFHIYITGIGGANYELRDQMNLAHPSDHAHVRTLVEARLLADGFVRCDVAGYGLLFTTIYLEPLEPEAVENKAEKAFFRRVGLTPHQLRAVQAELPVGASNDDDLFLLSCFSTDVLRECGLTRVQIAAWEKLIAEQTAA